MMGGLQLREEQLSNSRQNRPGALTKLGLSPHSFGTLILSVTWMHRKEVFVRGASKSNQLNNHNSLHPQ